MATPSWQPAEEAAITGRRAVRSVKRPGAALAEANIDSTEAPSYACLAMKTLVRNGTIVTAGETYAADLLIEDEKIVLIGGRIPNDPGADRVIDARGTYVMPGGIDVHT